MLTIYGASDDLVELEGVKLETNEDDDEEVWEGVITSGSDEINAIDSDVQITIGRTEATEGQNAAGIRVWMHYSDLGVWAANIMPIEEDAPCPWPVSVSVKGYSAVVKVNAPEGTPIAVVKVEAGNL